MIFLNSYARALALLCTAISLIPSSFIPASHLAPALPLSFSPQHSHSFLLFLSLYVNLVLILSFLFPAFLFGEHLFPLFVLPLYCASSTRPILHYYFLASFFHFVSSHTVFIVSFSTPSISSIHTATRAPRWIFILCVSYLHTTGLGLK